MLKRHPQISKREGEGMILKGDESVLMLNVLSFHILQTGLRYFGLTGRRPSSSHRRVRCLLVWDRVPSNLCVFWSGTGFLLSRVFRKESFCFPAAEMCFPGGLEDQHVQYFFQSSNRVSGEHMYQTCTMLFFFFLKMGKEIQKINRGNESRRR